MQILQFVKRIPRIPNKLYRETRDFILRSSYFLRLACRNRFGSSPLTQVGGPIVSLTTHGPRVKTVYLTIESIGNGWTLPSRLVLWLDDKEVFDHLPLTLQRLQKRGLEVRLCKNYGPHTKYFAYLDTADRFDVPLVTADDDQFYPRRWLRDLVQASNAYPNAVNCHWAVQVVLGQDGLAPYRTWVRCGLTYPSFWNFGLGVSGIIYPPSFLKALRVAGTGFEQICAKADDVWLHVQALRAGFKVRQIQERALRPLEIPGSQKHALFKQNDYAGGNDRQIKNVYTPADLSKLRMQN